MSSRIGSSSFVEPVGLVDAAREAVEDEAAAARVGVVQPLADRAERDVVGHEFARVEERP